MKTIIPILFIALASVHVSLLASYNPSYFFWPGDDGRPRLAIIHGGLAPEPKFDPAEVTFHLYTRTNPDFAIQMFVGDMNNAPFDPAKETKFIVHGFTSSAFTSWITEMKYTYLGVDDYNVIAVDWEQPAQGPFYDNAKFRADPTGTYLGEFMAYLQSQGADPTTFHCVGHSLGAHVCGFAGEKLLETSLVLGRISGLDPALPLYDYDNLGERLDGTDATFVDVVHAAGGTLAFWHPIGHVDFYPNNGEASQPGCGVDVTGACSHDRAHEYFHESITSTAFRSLLCPDVASFRDGLCDNNEAHPLGEHAPTSATHGTYYLKTNEVSPFAMG